MADVVNVGLSLIGLPVLQARLSKIQGMSLSFHNSQVRINLRRGKGIPLNDTENCDLLDLDT